LLGWVRQRRSRSAAVDQRATRILPLESNTPHVAAEYRALHTYLERRFAGVIVLTFEQVEALLGFALPAIASTAPEWWTNAVNPDRHAAAWTAAGRTAVPNLGARTITFERTL
jgi:hypothetical protein